MNISATMNRLWQMSQLVRHFGLRWSMFRLVYLVKLRSGWMERSMRSANWEGHPLARLLRDPSLAAPEALAEHRLDQGAKFFFDDRDRQRFVPWLAEFDAQAAGEDPLAEAEAVRRGEFRFFSGWCKALEMPPDWHANPITGRQLPADLHWSRTTDYDEGDIKAVWELNRFSFAYPLVRAYWRTGEEAFAETFWQLVEDWRRRNPPFDGPNWKCGQEASLRTMAWCFGLYGFLTSPSTTPQRVAQMTQMVATFGHRIEENIGYALSQQNNHGVSEGMGLWTIGRLFPELKRAARWRRRGREVLERLGRDLIYDDGSFSQHSFNYQRLMLHDYLWCIRLGELNGDPLSDELKQRVLLSARQLYQVQDEITGRVPCYGHNDGSLLLQLDRCGYEDFRPIVQATEAIIAGRRCFPEGPWDEDLLWLCGPEYRSLPVETPQRDDSAHRDGGYYTLRGEQGFAFTRCGMFRHRPAQADLLHVDIWWRGHNVALDPGTFSYNQPPPWDNGLCRTQYHNTVTVDGQQQMREVGRFVWLPWVKARAVDPCRSTQGHLAWWQGEHDGYQRLSPSVRYQRGLLRIGPEHWLMLDRLASEGEHDYRLQWLLCDVPYRLDAAANRLELETPSGTYHVQIGSSSPNGETTLVRGDATTPRGWRSTHYLDRQKALSLDHTVRDRQTLLWTVMGPRPLETALKGSLLSLADDAFRLEVRLGQRRLIDEATLRGVVSDRLAPISS